MAQVNLTPEQVEIIENGGMVFHSTQTIEQFVKANKVRKNPKGNFIGKYAGKSGKMFLGYLIPGSERPQFLAGNATERIEKPMISLISVGATDKDGSELYNEDGTRVIETKFMLHKEAQGPALVEEEGY